jgi:hypothetical protein
MKTKMKTAMMAAIFAVSAQLSLGNDIQQVVEAAERLAAADQRNGEEVLAAVESLRVTAYKAVLEGETLDLKVAYAVALDKAPELIDACAAQRRASIDVTLIALKISEEILVEMSKKREGA